jgi:hypothetical protein
MDLSVIQSKIYEIRGQRVMLDFDLAEMYGTETRVLKQAVRRNIERFPDDFLFRLTLTETNKLIHTGVSQNVIPHGYNTGGAAIFAFTERGVAMLSGVLSSKKAIEINISIMRAFVAVRNYLSQYTETSREIETLWRHVRELEGRSEENLKAINDLDEDNQKSFDEIYLALSELAKNQKTIGELKPRNPVGYIKPKDKE